MPFFSSSKRRKSEANLRSRTPAAAAPVVPEPPPSLPMTARLSVFGFDGLAAPAAQPPAMDRRGSRSATRVLDAARPEREAAQAPTAGRSAPPPRQDSASSGGWVDLAPQAASKPPTALRSTAPARTNGFASPPRRDSSFASTATGSSSATSPSRGSGGGWRGVGRQAMSPTPPTSEGGHEPFGLMGYGASEGAGAAGPSLDGLVGSPSTSFGVRSPSSGPTRANRPPAGLAPSSSFYGFKGPVSPVQSAPALPKRRESLQGRLLGAVENPLQKLSAAGTRAREASGGTSESEGYASVKQRRESLQAAPKLNGSTAGPRASNPHASPAETTPLASAFSSPASTVLPDNSLGLSSPRPSLPPGASPPAPSHSPSSRGGYNPLAAFYGAASPSLSGHSSTSLTDTTTNGSPVALFARQLSNGSGGDGSATTPGTSDSDYSDEVDPLHGAKKQPQPQQAVLQPPLQLDSSPRPSASPPRGRRPNPITPTRATSSPVADQAQQSATGPRTPRPQLSTVSRSSPASSRSPHKDRSALPSSFPSEPLNSASPRRDSPKRLLKKRPSSESPPPAPPAQPITRAPIPPALSLSFYAEKARAVRPVTPPKSPERAKKASSPPTEPVAPRAPPPRRSSLDPYAQANVGLPQKVVLPSLSPAPRSPTSRRNEGPTTPRSAAHPPVSPSKRAYPAFETTPRAAALAAARQREKKLAALETPVTKVGSDMPLSPPSSGEASPVEVIEERPLKPRVEYAFAVYPDTLLKSLLRYLSYADLISFRLVSRTIRRAIEVEGKELVLERFLGGQGYRSLARGAKSGKAAYLPSESEITLDLRDLSAFRAALRLTSDEYAHLARAYTHDPARFPSSQLRLARASTRAWNRVVLRLRLQTVLSASAFGPPAFPDLAGAPAPVYKSGRAASLRVWVPSRTGESWMSDAEVVECEREVWRSSGAWGQLRKGDVVANVAIPAFGNVGTLLFDGKFLRDLSFEFDVVGHLPAWLNMLEFSPSHFHNIVVASSSNPVFYLSLAPYVAAVRETITLCKDRVELSSPQGSYLVSRYVYRAALKLHAGQIIGDAAGKGGAGPGGIEVVHPDWAGQIVVEAEGTTEAATMLLARVASVEPTPWRIIREKSRPGKIWLRPALDAEPSA
ncbi:hypothetical protein JCM10450v2_002303 [Rhodotorula kratochvilovae]